MQAARQPLYERLLLRAVPDLHEAWNDPLAQWARETSDGKKLPLSRVSRLPRRGFVESAIVVCTLRIISYYFEGSLQRTAALAAVILLFLLLIWQGKSLLGLVGIWNRQRKRTQKSFINKGDFGLTETILFGRPVDLEPWRLFPLDSNRAYNLVVYEGMRTTFWQCEKRGLVHNCFPSIILIITGSISFSEGQFLFFGASLLFALVVLAMGLVHLDPPHLRNLKRVREHMEALTNDPKTEFGEKKKEDYWEVAPHKTWSQKGWLLLFILEFCGFIYVTGWIAWSGLSIINLTAYPALAASMLVTLYVLRLIIIEETAKEMESEKELFQRSWDKHWPIIAGREPGM